MTIDIKELRRLAQAALAGPDGISMNWIKLLQDFQQKASPTAVSELLDRLEVAKKEVALKERVIDALGSELNAVANERDSLRTVLADLLNDLEERAKWNLEESQRVVACGNGVYMRAKAALEETK